MTIKLNKGIIQHLNVIKECYHNFSELNNENCRVVTEPFRVIKLNDVIKNTEFISKLREAAASVPLNEKNNDLYTLKQSDSLLNVHDQVIQEFITFLKEKIQPNLESIFGYKFNETISITLSLYREGDMLLCHDDKCEDRCVAFVYYLTSVAGKHGGCFDMFRHDDSGQPTEIAVSIPPEQNSFICFEVGNYTYHQVSEVTSPCEARLSINGWFHNEKACSLIPIDYRDPLPLLHHQVALEGLVLLDEFINTYHCTPSYINQVRDTFSDESHILLTNFFTKSFFSLCKSSLQSPIVKWSKVGPANRRKYNVADLKQVKGAVGTLVNFIKSSIFVSYLKSISGLSLEPLSDAVIPLWEIFNAGAVVRFLNRNKLFSHGNEEASMLIVELQKWEAGNYTMATDNDSFFLHDGLDVYFFFNSSNTQQAIDEDLAGSITYLDAAGELSDPDNELLSIVPLENSFSAVYRTSDTVRFTKYINHGYQGSYYCLAATYYEVNHKF